MRAWFFVLVSSGPGFHSEPTGTRVQVPESGPWRQMSPLCPKLCRPDPPQTRSAWFRSLQVHWDACSGSPGSAAGRRSLHGARPDRRLGAAGPEPQDRNRDETGSQTPGQGHQVCTRTGSVPPTRPSPWRQGDRVCTWTGSVPPTRPSTWRQGHQVCTWTGSVPPTWLSPWRQLTDVWNLLVLLAILNFKLLDSPLRTDA